MSTALYARGKRTRSPAERNKLLRRHFVAMVQMLLEYGYCWFASPGRLRRLMRIEGLEHQKSLEGTPVILMMPHFTGLDLAGLRVWTETPLVSIYSRQKDAFLDEFFRTRRLRLGSGIIFSRQQGTRAVIRALRDGYRLYYLPDQDFGHRDSVFLPFFVVNAATITGLSRMAAVAGAVVLPCCRATRCAKLMATRWSKSRRWPTSRAPMPRPRCSAHECGHRKPGP